MFKLPKSNKKVCNNCNKLPKIYVWVIPEMCEIYNVLVLPAVVRIVNMFS